MSLKFFESLVRCGKESEAGAFVSLTLIWETQIDYLQENERQRERKRKERVLKEHEVGRLTVSISQLTWSLFFSGCDFSLVRFDPLGHYLLTAIVNPSNQQVRVEFQLHRNWGFYPKLELQFRCGYSFFIITCLLYILIIF